MKRLLSGLVIGAVIMGGAVAAASIPGSNGVISACYLTSGPPQARGALRVIDTESGQHCESNEVPISWDSTAPHTVSDLGYEAVQTTTPLQENGQTSLATADCSNGVVLGGGFRSTDAGDFGPSTAIILSSEPNNARNGWRVTARDAGPNDGVTVYVTVSALCLSYNFAR